MTSDVLKSEILELVRQYWAETHKPGRFCPGKDSIPSSGKVYGPEEMVSLIDSSLEFWLTSGRYNESFERKLSEYLGVKHVITTNSGSSANLLSLAALASPQLNHKMLRPGDEIITVAAAFPTTVNPLLLYGMVPVFVDIDIPYYNIDASKIESAVSKRTRAIMIAHTLGNPFDIDQVLQVARKYDLWVIEDCCDALGSRYDGKLVGTFGHIGTLSFYPAHHITMGEGGAVFTNDDTLSRIVSSIRDWGRDCHCPPGKDNSCGKRFSQSFDGLPEGYDHKYTYSNLGYNLKITDMQAAVGLEQLNRLPRFIEIRKANFFYLKKRLARLEEFLILPIPTPKSDPAWFGFPITIRNEAQINRAKLIKYLDQHRIGIRLLFGGNLTRQPYFKGRKYRVYGSLKNTDQVMNNTFWIGIYPGLNETMLDFVVDKMQAFFRLNF